MPAHSGRFTQLGAALRLAPAVCALLIVTGCGSSSSPSAPSSSSGGGGTTPSGSQQVTIAYSGRFDMTNLAQPQRTPHSYTYGIQWRFTWNGSWDQLFGGGRTSSGQMSFQVVDITGTVNATYRDIANGPDVRCTITLSADPASPPTFIAAFDSSRRVVQITNADAPTFRFTRSSSADPKCLGGPGVNIFSQPADWSPIGNGGGTVASSGGTQDFDKRWQWTHTFAGGEVRNFDATFHSTVQLQVR